MQSYGAPGMQEIIVIGLIIVLLLGTTAVWVWSIVHCAKNQRLSDNNRIIGIILIVVLGLLGSLVYLFLPRESPPES